MKQLQVQTRKRRNLVELVKILFFPDTWELKFSYIISFIMYVIYI